MELLNSPYAQNVRYQLAKQQLIGRRAERTFDLFPTGVLQTIDFINAAAADHANDGRGAGCRHVGAPLN